MPNRVTRDQFQFLSDVEVVHVPTGAKFSTYRYADPANAGSTHTENLGRLGERLEGGEEYSAAEVRVMAVGLLREKALQG